MGAFTANLTPELLDVALINGAVIIPQVIYRLQQAREAGVSMPSHPSQFYHRTAASMPLLMQGSWHHLLLNNVPHLSSAICWPTLTAITFNREETLAAGAHKASNAAASSNALIGINPFLFSVRSFDHRVQTGLNRG